ncbi:MAG: DUF1553 domain-containing protein [Cyclobacteriaceae bacterium]
MKFNTPLLVLLAGLVMSCQTTLPDDVAVAYDKLPQALDFNVHVKPILSDKCFLCHGPDKQKQQAGLQLDIAEAAYGELPENPGKFAIKPGNLRKSEVFHRILSHDPEVLMPTPKSNLSLTAYEKAVLVKWIEDGAEYKPHWAFIKPDKTEPPIVSSYDWAKNPIDNFVVKKLETKGLKPSKESDKELLLRRLSFDLTGLPPTTDEINNFISDDSDGAYEKQVDRLLASPHYGEKMAMDWMDLARFADTHGYSVDRFRDMSPWRDWVIDKFNENMPYDEFVTWQMAGDLLPNPSKEQILATAFNRIHPQNMEGGIVAEEFRVEYVLDRVNTAGSAFMALTLGCSRCHDHKYDPISQKDYFEMSSFFNNVNEAGQISWDDALPVPTMLWTTKEQDELLAMLDSQANEKADQHKRLIESESASFEKWLNEEGYRKLSLKPHPTGIQAHFELENKKLENKLNPSQKGKMERQGSNDEKPSFVEAKNGKGLLMDGDAWLSCGDAGAFKRSQSFSIGISVKIPKDIKNGVIFHKGIGAALYNFRGYHLALKNNRLELLMARSTPDNAIIEYASDIPKNEWLQFVVTYDGSSTATGYKVYMNGQELSTKVEVDNLYKEIDFYHLLEDKQPGLQIGARWRGVGIGGAIVDDVMVFNRELSLLEVLMIADKDTLNVLASKSRNELTQSDIEALRTYYLSNKSSVYKESLKELEKARSTYNDSIESVQELMVMKEMPEARPTYLLKRGQYDAHGEEVFPNTPKSILPMPGDLPKNRLGFAKWLMHSDHPLTARVTVNRYWQNYFGRGLVRTTEDFGNQGELPSHPQLLDWLAIEFMESGWDVKALQKLIVMSATYRQSSITSEELREIDGENVLLARGPTLRLSSEMVRDNALLASGLLNKDIGGKSVKPYQPDGLWRVNGKRYVRDSSSSLYRRSLYTLWKRSVPHPTLATFDAPERSECTVRRQKTNTPLQALVLLNDPTFIEASKVIGEQMTKSDDVKSGLEEAFLKLTGRSASTKEVDVLLEMQQKIMDKFMEKEGKSQGWLSAGEYEYDSTLDPIMVAANAVVASTIMNSDATITKR